MTRRAGAGSSIAFTAKGKPDNVVDLMVGKLIRLPIETQATLQQLACLGNVAEITMLSIVQGKSNDEVRSDLRRAVHLELVEQLGTHTSSSTIVSEKLPIHSYRNGFAPRRTF